MQVTICWVYAAGKASANVEQNSEWVAQVSRNTRISHTCTKILAYLKQHNSKLSKANLHIVAVFVIFLQFAYHSGDID